MLPSFTVCTSQFRWWYSQNARDCDIGVSNDVSNIYMTSGSWLYSSSTDTEGRWIVATPRINHPACDLNRSICRHGRSARQRSVVLAGDSVMRLLFARMVSHLESELGGMKAIQLRDFPFAGANYSGLRGPIAPKQRNLASQLTAGACAALVRVRLYFLTTVQRSAHGAIEAFAEPSEAAYLNFGHWDLREEPQLSVSVSRLEALLKVINATARTSRRVWVNTAAAFPEIDGYREGFHMRSAIKCMLPRLEAEALARLEVMCSRALIDPSPYVQMSDGTPRPLVWRVSSALRPLISLGCLQPGHRHTAPLCTLVNPS